MTKIINDKYYTPQDLAQYIVDKTKEIIGEENITEYIEPSAGSGVFLDYLDKPHMAYDIEPEDSRIIQQDYLILDIPYKKGRCIIGNPPFGELRKDLVYKFYKKSIQIAEYIAFILPISKLNNTSMMCQYDLIYSEDLGVKEYSNISIHCCFNIYKRPENGKLHKRPKFNLNDIEIIRQDQKKFIGINDYDLRIAHWGNGCVGKILKGDEHYANEYKILIHNKDLKDKIIIFFETIDWKKKLKCVSMLRLYKKDIYKYIKEQIPEIE